MRTNLPITQQEYLLPDGMTIVSRTDLKGRITYVNPDFLVASGFDESELIGKAHNLVRHPDMPEEAFADLWATLQAGRPWTGFVKNRRKNGDFYWVCANATPILENGQVTGYLSVRTRPTPRCTRSPPAFTSTPTTCGTAIAAAAARSTRWPLANAFSVSCGWRAPVAAIDPAQAPVIQKAIEDYLQVAEGPHKDLQPLNMRVGSLLLS